MHDILYKLCATQIRHAIFMGCIPKICHLDLSGLGKLIEFLQVVKLGKRLYPLAG